ncbi:META domain-containing protein [Parabacteroides sp. AF48-14]|nr:META domain-containing protein [Parabacteroides sp. AF48-14]
MKRVCVFLCLAVCFGCSDDSDNPEEQTQIETEQQWQLTAIVENGAEVATPGNCKTAYLILEEDGTFRGLVGVNQLDGTFDIDPISGKISFKYTMTQLGSLEPNVIEFEKMYMKLFGKIISYISSDDDLKLYYGDNSYLQYQIEEVEKL